MLLTREMSVSLPETAMTSPIYMDVTKAPFRLHGFHEPFVRVPADAAEKTGEAVARLAKNTAGGRVCFKTDSDYVVIHADIISADITENSSPAANAGFDMYEKINGEYVFRGVIPPNRAAGKPYVEGRNKYGNRDMKDFVIFFPLGASVRNMYIGLREGSLLEEGSEYTYKDPVVFYGSSIVHGGGTRPGSPYSAVLSRRLDMDFRNIGFGGNAKAEPAIIDHIASLPMSVFVYDYDHNAPTPEFLEETHYSGYKRFREKQPTTPVIMASLANYHTRIYSWDYFTFEDHEKRRAIIENSYKRALAEGDENVYFVDGSKMIPRELAADATTDGLHPNDLGYYFMANAFEPVIRKLIEK